ncbi:DinB family protein [Apibacter sp. B3919]|uniref:DinB family protein n=1 Tax=unclassified Apibacter TaxID=2630820 RepID=UPI0013222FCA|nr:DinB family protein [Apibacter sp. B3919]MXO24151.1 DinB family protein [Apibacter sp. B3924]MXO26933.1 DinB family protein [Apibacter sp. B3813]MXO28939.1 DinB family protein [Apibacter sp. B3913]MXO30890.1 DinB family protein [Apibacter sp. B3912]MXP02095.1 DinB family protein [Apibacter sp. B3918]
MKKQFEIFKIFRKSLVQEIDDLSIEQLQKIPEGFKNNIFWNVAHTLVSQQILHYKMSGLNPLITNDWIENYQNGSFPRFVITEDEIDYLKSKLIITAEQLEEDFNEKKFESYTEFETKMGIVISSVEDAINFNNTHEALHYGIVSSMKKLV